MKLALLAVLGLCAVGALAKQQREWPRRGPSRP